MSVGVSVVAASCDVSASTPPKAGSDDRLEGDSSLNRSRFDDGAGGREMRLVRQVKTLELSLSWESEATSEKIQYIEL